MCPSLFYSIYFQPFFKSPSHAHLLPLLSSLNSIICSPNTLKLLPFVSNFFQLWRSWSAACRESPIPHSTASSDPTPDPPPAPAAPRASARPSSAVPSAPVESPTATSRSTSERRWSGSSWAPSFLTTRSSSICWINRRRSTGTSSRAFCGSLATSSSLSESLKHSGLATRREICKSWWTRSVSEFCYFNRWVFLNEVLE